LALYASVQKRSKYTRLLISVIIYNLAPQIYRITFIYK
jgi:hypothetical protein